LAHFRTKNQKSRTFQTFAKSAKDLFRKSAIALWAIIELLSNAFLQSTPRRCEQLFNDSLLALKKFFLGDYRWTLFS